MEQYTKGRSTLLAFNQELLGSTGLATYVFFLDSLWYNGSHMDTTAAHYMLQHMIEDITADLESAYPPAHYWKGRNDWNVMPWNEKLDLIEDRLQRKLTRDEVVVFTTLVRM